VLRRRSHGIEILGIGHTEARGMKGGAVVDLAEAESGRPPRRRSRRARAWRACSSNRSWSSLSSGRLASEFYAVNVNVARSAFSDGDIARAAGGRQPAHSVRDGRVVLHALPIGYALDGVHGIRDPRGMLARRFGVDMHVVTADVAAARNLMLAIERCHSRSRPWWPRPICRGLAALPTTRPISAPRWSTWAPAPPPSRCSRAGDSSMPTASRSAATTSPWIWRAG
jgi:cell division protein FtsA